jgi:plastocyanin
MMLRMMTHKLQQLALLAALPLILASCGDDPRPRIAGGGGSNSPSVPEKDEPKGGSSSSSAKTLQEVKVSAGPEGAAPDAKARVFGVVLYKGEAPERRPITISGGGCHPTDEELLSEKLVVVDGKVANAFVYIDKGLADGEFEVPDEPVVLNQVGCMYSPHVVALRVGQELHVMNSDDTTHNVHSPTRNVNQPSGSKAQVVTYERSTIGDSYVCDIHPWMSAYVCAIDHPFFALTGPDGRFELPELAPGKYRLTAWQEKCGRVRAEFTVPPGGTAEVSFQVSAGGSSGRGRR